MEPPIEIKFDFPVAHSDLNFFLTATAELHHSEPYYLVYDFQLENSPGNQGQPSILPPQEIKQIKRDGKMVWVHKDSERESLLSLIMGKAIEEALNK